MENKEIEHVEILIGKILRVGVIVSCSVMIFGFLFFLITGKSGYSANSYPTSLKEMIEGVIQWRPFAFLMTGMFLLILTPVLRVVASIYAFAVEKDKLYVGITILVLFILMIAMCIGAG